MPKKSFPSFITLALTSLLVGCGPDCVSLCEQAQDEGDCFDEVSSDGDTRDTDCEDFCEDVEEVVDEEKAGCEDEYDELLSCMSDADNACDSLEDECEDDRDELEECIADYCDDNSSDECEELAEVDID